MKQLYHLKTILILFAVILSYLKVASQEKNTQEMPTDDYVSNIFNNNLIVNAQTTETISKGSFEFRIQHRFSEMDLNNFQESVLQNFLGFDGFANIRLSFAFALSDNLQIGIGRTKIGKVVDFDVKYRLLKQKETSTPISMTFYFDTGISTKDFSQIGPGDFFSDLKTPFKNKFAHRITYNTQLLLSKKFGEKLSLELNPTFIYKNLVPAGYNNFIVAVAFGGRYKTGFKSYIVFEFSPKFNNRKNNYTDPLSIGYEIGTAGHTFQVFLSNTNHILEQNMYFSQPFDYTNGKILIGFNIKRTFWNK